MSVETKSSLPLVETLRGCPVCESPNQSPPVFPPHINRCGHCRVLYMSPRPDQAGIRRHYDAGNTYGEWRKQRNERDRVWRARLRLVTKHARAGRLLDVAAGDGHFLSIAAGAGFEAEGTEVSAAGSGMAGHGECKIHMGQIRDLGLAAESFDVVTMWHALEHVPDPGSVLGEVRRLLRPGGMAFIAVPNEQKKILEARFGILRHPFGDGIFARDSEIHLTFFTPSTLKRAVRNAGFAIEAFGVDDIYVTVTPLSRLKTGAHRLLSAVFGWHFGIAMWAAARKPWSRS